MGIIQRGYPCGLVAAFLLAVVTACGTFQQPEVTLEGVRLGGLGLQGGTLLVDVRVVNPNRVSLTADRLRYDLEIGQAGDAEAESDTAWSAFASGTYEEEFSVAARDTGRVRIPVDFEYAALGGAASSLLRNGSFDYRATGSVHARTPLGNRDVPFRRTGRMSLDGGW